MAHQVRRLISDMNAYEPPYEVFSTLKEGYVTAAVYVDDASGELLFGPHYLKAGEDVLTDQGLAVCLNRKVFEVDFEIGYETPWDEFAEDIATAFYRALQGHVDHA